MLPRPLVTELSAASVGRVVSGPGTRIQGGDAVRVRVHPGAEIRPKSRLGDLKLVNAEVHGVETIKPGIIALGRELDAGIDPDQAHTSAGDCRAGLVQHRARDVPRLVWACAARVSVRTAASKLHRVFSYLPVLSVRWRREEPVQSTLDAAKRARVPGSLRYCWFPPLSPEDTSLVVPNTTMEEGLIRIW